MWKISDADMRHYHFLKSTCDIGDPPLRAPGLCEATRTVPFDILDRWVRVIVRWSPLHARKSNPLLRIELHGMPLTCFFFQELWLQVSEWGMLHFFIYFFIQELVHTVKHLDLGFTSPVFRNISPTLNYVSNTTLKSQNYKSRNDCNTCDIEKKIIQ